MKWMLALVVATTGLAGCSEGPNAAEDPGVVTDPADYSYLQNDTGAHVHDYWDGADEMEVLWRTQSYTFNNVGGPGSTWTTRFYPPDDHVVPQGTSELRITVTWSETSEELNSYGDLDLWMQPADATEPVLAKENLVSGQAFLVPLSYAQADLPHQQISGWEFQVRIHGSSAPHNLFFGSVTLKVDAVRGLELQPFPAHPDQWQNETAIRLAEAEGQFTRISYTGTGGFPPLIGALEGALVPLGTKEVLVALTTQSDVPIGALDLFYHGANTRQWTAAEPVEVSEQTRAYHILVDDEMVDGPYARASLWEFQLRTSTEPGQGLFVGSYDLVAVAIRE